MAGFDDARDLIAHAATDLAKIRKDYEQALHTQSISATLRVDIKNFFENLRSALDFAAVAVFEKHGTFGKKNPKVYFPYAVKTQGRAEFEKYGRIEACIPGISASRPDIVSALLEMQHFGSRGYTWLPAFMELCNENKHQRLAPQVRRETKELRISGQGASISLGQGASISIGQGASISIGGAVIQGGQSFDVTNPPKVLGGKTEVITWVSFHFEANQEAVMPLLEAALRGVQGIVKELAALN
jgi:hypothetical protein